jgi:hypothetical protein
LWITGAFSRIAMTADQISSAVIFIICFTSKKWSRSYRCSG